ncbi:MAG: CRISPR-associated protein Cas4 [Methanobrevibacter sp.]|uniref:CRISPR-associated protein Cas4 n=1 Tax=Methanobrevibacter sp. TaxID=66852 RepID=UPI0026DEE344|nr:CRISPR-associated protein Cas4 [Methanobrevibacter sp.]MDO5848703.1 CRISPR-associated protein Cas4 [Methanobrevibacter sp.]
MENKLIQSNAEDYDIEKHPNIKGVQIIEGKNNFPISWLNQQGYCEYQIYLQYFKDIKVGATAAMKQGTAVHNELENKFKETAEVASFEDVMEMSKETATISREVFVISPENGIRGFIDEIQMTPTEFIIIDDKPGTTPYNSTINQVRAYCLAFKELIGDDTRKIRGALRQRGTDNIFWSEEFNEDVEKSIKFVLDRMEGLFNGTKPFIPTKNKNKCRSCRYQSYCEHF